MSYRGRFAPTPSGPLHFGSLVTALASWLDARYHRGEWRVRMDDLDPPREQPGAADTILRQLEAFGLHWDGALLYQSKRGDAYQAALNALMERGQAFYCTLSRQQLKALGNVHPGPSVAQPPGPDRAVRLTVPVAALCFDDRLQGRVCAQLADEEGPFVIRRRDGLFSYQLACALDDRDQGITDVVRGADLLTSTLRQIRVLDCLGATAPRYAHLPVILQPDGRGKISKSVGGAALNPDLKGPLTHAALTCLGLSPPAGLQQAPVTDLLQWARENWTPALLPRGTELPAPALLQGGQA
ncbi:tRNA glutamyl-Q(34) synthetase GluQRS [Alloalcanivorax xenomutans]|uniref:tRNA glutamyl-Q(34) synthetase GluQRS n=1 Tax=Alloalcanivorax xenomutans TaxID=1094342 RepID=UPI0009B6B5FE|nr:tRNA glutamyl-Q(34) synthetase GluQRS [Alloalcanivorax xenomutans]ARB47147.1 glutamyl-Q tRNA(Asp) ligase [Alloalcanivorax xenomutans]MCE7525303.1 tRNA glutamyl-Q(34) synthetase GluQRS [Alloalcanivorax xenomutans]